jgi:hypothetical protein
MLRLLPMSDRIRTSRSSPSPLDHGTAAPTGPAEARSSIRATRRCWQPCSTGYRGTCYAGCGSMGSDVSHPLWCDRTQCAVIGASGCHVSPGRVVRGRYGRTVVVLNRGPAAEDPTTLHVQSWAMGTTGCQAPCSHSRSTRRGYSASISARSCASFVVRMVNPAHARPVRRTTARLLTARCSRPAPATLADLVDAYAAGVAEARRVALGDPAPPYVGVPFTGNALRAYMTGLAEWLRHVRIDQRRPLANLPLFSGSHGLSDAPSGRLQTGQ